MSPTVLPTLGANVPSSDQDAFDWLPFSQALQTADAMLTANSKLIDAGAIKSKTSAGAAYLRSPGGGTVASWQSIAAGDLPSGIPRANLTAPLVTSNVALSANVSLPTNAFTDLLTLSFTMPYAGSFYVVAQCVIALGGSATDAAIDLAVWSGLPTDARSYVARARGSAPANGFVPLTIGYLSPCAAGLSMNLALQGQCTLAGGTAQANNQTGGRSGITTTSLGYMVL